MVDKFKGVRRAQTNKRILHAVTFKATSRVGHHDVIIAYQICSISIFSAGLDSHPPLFQ